ncbi:MAG: sporulation protein YunB [Christensenellales bacterium]|nr:sporulation protein YunB [Christensenellales bacterium]
MAACARKKSGGMRWLILLVLLLTAAVIAMEQNLSQTMLDMAFARAYSMAVETINRAVKQAMGQGVAYEELIDAQMDAQGRVSMLRANTMRMNELASQTALLAERELGSAENQVVEIPLGAALGVSFLSGFGPRLEVQILPVGAVHTSFDTEFETAGINQTRHKIFLNLRATVSLIVPTGSQLVEVTSTVPIAESIIVGEVPESFVDVNNEEDMLNLIP